MKNLFGLLICVLVASLVWAGEEQNNAAPAFTLTDSNGNAHSLADFKGKIVVLEWVNYDCPFVKKHYKSNNMQALQKKYTEKGVVWLSICSSAEGKQGNFSAEEINQRMKDCGAAPTAYLVDADGTVGKAYGAATTPHMFVISAEGEFLYKGAIDSDRSANPEAIATATNYVAQALDFAVSGEGEKPENTKSYGCSVKYGK